MEIRQAERDREVQRKLDELFSTTLSIDRCLRDWFEMMVERDKYDGWFVEIVVPEDDK